MAHRCSCLLGCLSSFDTGSIPVTSTPGFLETILRSSERGQVQTTSRDTRYAIRKITRLTNIHRCSCHLFICSVLWSAYVMCVTRGRQESMDVYPEALLIGIRIRYWQSRRVISFVRFVLGDHRSQLTTSCSHIIC